MQAAGIFSIWYVYNDQCTVDVFFVYSLNPSLGLKAMLNVLIVDESLQHE